MFVPLWVFQLCIAVAVVAIALHVIDRRNAGRGMSFWVGYFVAAGISGMAWYWRP